MRERFYTLLTVLSKIFGTWFFVLVSGGIAAGYFLFRPQRVSVGVDFYRTLFPERSRPYHLWCVWLQFQKFTSVFLDRYLLEGRAAIRYTFQGREHLIHALKQNTGGILLMSHMGNWEVGARLLRQNIPDLRLMLYMGRQAKDQIERLQKQDLKTSGIRIVAVDRDGGSPFDLVEGVSFLKSGGFVSLAGDVVWRQDQRVVTARFLGRTVHLPETPHILALVSGAPLFIFFATHQGDRHYHFSVSPPLFVRAATRAQRRQAISRSAQDYADRIERQLRRSPFEWYHFKPFLGPEIRSESLDF